MNQAISAATEIPTRKIINCTKGRRIYTTFDIKFKLVKGSQQVKRAGFSKDLATFVGFFSTFEDGFILDFVDFRVESDCIFRRGSRASTSYGNEAVNAS